MFKSGGVTKIIKVKQGVELRPKIQLSASNLSVVCGQTVTIQLNISNVEELDGYS